MVAHPLRLMQEVDKGVEGDGGVENEGERGGKVVF